MIVAVLDTNVLASGLIGEKNPNSAPGELLRRWRAREYLLVVSRHILDELSDTLANPYFSQRLSGDDIARALASVATDAVVQPLTISVIGVASHPEDDLVLATALSAGADYLVTGDRRLRERGQFGDTRSVTAREFLEILDGEN